MEEEQTDGVGFSPQEWRAMLEDIGRAGLLLGKEIAQAKQTFTPTARPVPAATPQEQLEALTVLWPQIERLARTLARHPHREVHSEALPVPLSRTQGGARVASVLTRSPQPLVAYLASKLPHAAPQEQNITITDRHPVASTNNLENRLIATLLSDWERQCFALTALAESCGEVEAATTGKTLGAGIRRCLQSEIWREQTRLSEQEFAVFLTGDRLLRCSAPCRALFALWRSTHSPLTLDWSDNALLESALRAPWQLYEMWCFLRAAVCLRVIGWQPVDNDFLRVAPKGLHLSLATGRSSRLRFRQGGSECELLYQPLFPSANQSFARTSALQAKERSIAQQSDFTSRTHAMQPDIAFLYAKTLYLLDAKFRAYERLDTIPTAYPRRQDNALLDDLDKMHAYRDSITGVAEAWCLYPGKPGEKRTAITYPESTHQHPFGTAGIGAIRLRPGSDTAMLERLLRIWTD